MTLLDIFLTIQQDAAGTPGQPQGSGISMIIMLVLMLIMERILQMMWVELMFLTEKVSVHRKKLL